MRVSVVMPVYNVELYVEKAITSILSQSFADLELIVIDDGSADETPRIVERVAKTDARVKLLRQRNAGIVVALTLGLNEAQGEYITRADGDDYYHPGRLLRQVEVMDSNPELVLLATDYEKVFLDGTKVREYLPQKHDDIVKSLFIVNRIMHSGVLMRHSALVEAGGYRQEWVHLEDYDLWFRLARQGKIASLPEPLSFFCIHNESISAKKEMLQVRRALLLRCKLLLGGHVPLTWVRFLWKPILKSLGTTDLLNAYRKSTGRRRG